MPPQISYTAEPMWEPAEFSMEDAVLNTWVEDTGNYLRLEPEAVIPLEAPPPDQA